MTPSQECLFKVPASLLPAVDPLSISLRGPAVISSLISERSHVVSMCCEGAASPVCSSVARRAYERALAAQSHAHTLLLTPHQVPSFRLPQVEEAVDERVNQAV